MVRSAIVRWCVRMCGGATCTSHEAAHTRTSHLRTHLRTVARSHRRTTVAAVLLTIVGSYAAAQTIYRTPDGQERRLGNPRYDGRFVFTRIRYSGPSFGGGFGFGGSRWSHDYPAA